MKKLHKSLLATAVAAAMAPSAFALEAEAPSIHGSFDVSLALKIADEVAFAVDDAPGDFNYLGLEGEVKLNNGNSLTYAYYEAVKLSEGGFAGNYQGYIGYKMDSIEIRGGALDTPLRQVLDKSDLFANSYADANNVFLTNTTATDAVMLLGGSDALSYAVSLDFAQQGAESANNEDSLDGMRIGAMVNFAISDSFSMAAGLEALTDVSTAFGLSGELGLDGGMGFTFGLEIADIDATDNSPMNFVIGGFMPMSEKGTFKAQLGYGDPDVDNVDAGTYIALGYDHQLAEAVTGYFLLTTGADNGLTLLGEGTVPDDGSATVLATGLKVSF
jgi:hypothetical protein